MDELSFQWAYFLRQFYYSKEKSSESANKIIGDYLDIYNLSREIYPILDLDSVEDISLDCFYMEFYNTLKGDFLERVRGWC